MYCMQNFFTFPGKTEFALKFFTVLNTFFNIQDFWATCAWGFLSNLRLTEFALKIFTVVGTLLDSRFSSNLRLPWKRQRSLNFFTVLNTYFLSFRIFEQLALALKNRVVLKIFTVLKIWILLRYIFLSHFRIFEQLALTFRTFEQLALALKKTVCPEFFYCIKYTFFIIQDFWATCACPEFTVLNVYFFSFRIGF